EMACLLQVFCSHSFISHWRELMTVSIPSRYSAVLRALCEVVPVNVAFCAHGIDLDKGFNHCM
ncbi:MAG: hypothetical protein PV354_10490, partial [Bartonella sp.]|nr:hypothetical protein [Bartonella sp.]